MKESAECLNLRKMEEQMVKQQKYFFILSKVCRSPRDSAKGSRNGEKRKGDVPKAKTSQDRNCTFDPHGQTKNIKGGLDEKDQSH